MRNNNNKGLVKDIFSHHNPKSISTSAMDSFHTSIQKGSQRSINANSGLKKVLHKKTKSTMIQHSQDIKRFNLLQDSYEADKDDEPENLQDLYFLQQHI